MASVLVPIAQGCEELEAVTVIDLLRRAKIDVTTAGLDDQPVKASRGTVLVPDTALDEALTQSFDMIILPGGLPGADHLDSDSRIHAILQSMARAGKYVAAICAAPKVLAHAGLLNNRSATSFPGTLENTGIDNIQISVDPVVVDDNIITSRGPGTAMDFALTLIETLVGKSVRDQVESTLQRP
ncbi:MAG: DJ-1 family glyoxalase III [Gammaproteobacteria bacterium]